MVKKKTAQVALTPASVYIINIDDIKLKMNKNIIMKSTPSPTRRKSS